MNPTRTLFPNPLTFHPGASFGAAAGPVTNLQRVILDRAQGSVKYGYNGASPEITTTLHSVSAAVESAFVLVPREALPKLIQEDITLSPYSPSRSFYFEGHDVVTVNRCFTADGARRMANKWLALAQKLEREEKSAADAARAKADAEASAAAAAKIAREVRLDELAAEYFEAAYTYLGARKARVVEDMYKLEQQLADADQATADANGCGCDE